MARPCTCDRYRPGEPCDIKQDCHLCWLYHNEKAYKMLWDGVSGPFFYGWVLIAENDHDPRNWVHVACETSEPQAYEITERERQRAGSVRGLVTCSQMNPAEPGVWVNETPHRVESWVDRLTRLGQWPALPHS